MYLEIYIAKTNIVGIDSAFDDVGCIVARDKFAGPSNS